MYIQYILSASSWHLRGEMINSVIVMEMECEYISWERFPKRKEMREVMHWRLQPGSLGTGCIPATVDHLAVG